MAILADDLLTGVKRRVSLPASQVLLENSDILDLADAIIRGKIVPLFESVDEEYLVTSIDTALVASVSEYDIPYRAIGRALREIKLKDADNDSSIRNLAKIAIEDLQLYTGSSLTTGFYFKGDRLHLVDSVPATLTDLDTLEIWFRQPPNKLVEGSDCATVISATTTIVTVDAVPDTFTASTPLDFIQGKSGNRIYDIDITPTAAGTTTLTFTSGDIPTSLEAGDYISLAGYSPVVNYIPDDAYSYLETALARRVLKAIGDYEAAKELGEDETEERKELLKVISPRITGEPTIIINRTGLVRGNKYSQRRFLFGQ